MLKTIDFRLNSVPFKNAQQLPQQYSANMSMPEDTFVMEDYSQIQKKEKSQEKLQKLSAWGTVGIAAGLLGSLFFGMYTFFKNKGGRAKAIEENIKEVLTEAQNLNFKDVKNEKTFEQLTLSKEMKKVVEDLKTTLDRAEWLKKKGSSGGSGIMLYGEPGGGKNAYVYALTKYMEEKFPGSKLIMMDVLKFKGMFNGQTENNIIGFVENVIKEANANPKQKFIVFLDEFDSIARKDMSSSASMSESFQNAFKTTLTNLTSVPNIQVIAATNKATKNAPLDALLDDAILNRFPTKIHVPLPTKEQLKAAFVEHYKSLPKEFVDDALKDINNKDLERICSYVVEEGHHASFRDMQYILEKARIISEAKDRTPGSKITIKDLEKAAYEHGSNENWRTPGLKETVSEPTAEKKLSWWKRLFKRNK